MIALPPRRWLVLWRTVSAAVVIVRDDGIAVVADRAGILDGVELMEGVAAPAPDAAKLFATDAGLSVAVLGKGTVVTPDGRILDLRDEVLAAVDGVQEPVVAAEAIRRRFDDAATAVRAHAGRGEFQVPPMASPALTIAIVAGVVAGRPTSYLVGLTISGPSTLEFLTQSTAFAPARCLADLQLAAATSVTAESVNDAVIIAVDAVRQAAVTEPSATSLDVDVAQNCPGTDPSFRTVRYEPHGMPPGV